jgi:transposase
MQHRRIIGIDLGIRTAHTAVVVDETGAVVGRRQVRPHLESFEALEALALRDAEEGARLSVVIEPTGISWLPVAVFFIRRGHTVYRVSSQKAFDLRKYFERYSKTNQIDALTLAKMPIVDAASLVPLELAEGPAASLDRRVRACDRLRREIALHKTRVRELARQAMPAVDHAMDTACRDVDLVVLGSYGDPRLLAGLSPDELCRFVRERCQLKQVYALKKATAWIEVARAAAELYGDDPAVPFCDLADEMASEVAIIEVLERELCRHESFREAAYLEVDPHGLARSLPGFGEVGAPVLVAGMGRPGRFPDAKSFRRYTGLTPKASETGESDAKGQPMTKAGSNRLRTQLVLSANIARTIDPELARIYWTHMVERGAHHNKAVCIVAARLADRAWLTMTRGEPYVLRDVDGRQVSLAEGRAIVAANYRVPEEVRRRRRTRKRVGKAPQEVLVAHR